MGGKVYKDYTSFTSFKDKRNMRVKERLEREK